MNHKYRFGNVRGTLYFRPYLRSLVFGWVLAMVMSLACPGAPAAENRKILVLHSYHQGLAWTDSISQGIQTTISPLNKGIELYFEYLDIKRRPQPISESALMYAFQNRLKQTAFDVIIASDDEAIGLVRRLRANSSFDTPLVFCGLSHFDPEMTAGPHHTTGILKTVDHRANLDLMLKLHPQCRRIVLMFDWAAVEIEHRGALSNLVAEIPGHLVTDIWSNPDLDQLPAKLQGLGSDDLVYMLAVNRDKSLKFLYNAEAVELVSRWSPVAVYSPLEAYLGHGVVGGKITSGIQQGELAAQMALRIISGQPADTIPVITQSPNPYRFDYRQLKQHGIQTSLLPPESIIGNQPPGFWVRWGKIVAIISGAVLLTAMIPLVSIMILLKNRHALAATMRKLDTRLKEKTVHLKLLNQKLKRQSRLDALTGLANRRYILQRFGEELKRAQRYDTPLSIALLDLDHFKQINSEIGYIVGDQIIRDTARAIRNCLREIDLVGRFSGEAFLIVLPNSDLGMVQHSMKRIFDTVRSLQWENGQVRVTLSGGLAQYSGQTLAQLTTQAENRQQEAKTQGGDRFLPHDSSRACARQTPLTP